MMKKLLLLLASGVVMSGAYAQYNQNVPVVSTSIKLGGVPAVHEVQGTFQTKAEMDKMNRAANKGTGLGGDRWYDHFGIVDQFEGGALQNNDYVFYIWQDSTVTQRFVDQSTQQPYYDRVNYSSVSQVIDPLTSELFNDPGFAGQNIIQVKNFNSYTVDSVYIRGAYVLEPGASTQPDTLIFSVIPMDNLTFFYTKSDYPKITQYSANADTVWAMAPTNVDSIERAAFSPTSLQATNPRVFWKVPLTQSMGDTQNANGTFATRTYTFPVPNGGLQVPAGSRFAITCTYKYAGNWQANVDSITMFNRFMPVTGPVQQNAAMPYYRETFNDRSMSGNMFSWVPSRYTPALGIEIFNENSFGSEFHAMGGHVVCNDCDYVGINDVASEIFSTAAYPNPATSTVNVPFSLNSTNNVTVTLTNAVGQVVRTQNFDNVTKGMASFDVASLSEGLYIYSVEVNGTRETGKVSVVH